MTNNTYDAFYFSFANESAYQYYRVTLISSDVGYTRGNGFKIQFYGIENRTNVIHSAANDTIYMMEDGSKVILTTTDSDGVGTLNFMQFDDGVTYTLYSTVAYLPGSSSTKFNKGISITKTRYGCTTEAYLMPDAAKTLYWYGYESADAQDCNKLNGWTIDRTYSNSTSFNDPQHNTNYLSMSSSATSSTKTMSGFGSKTKAIISKIHAVGKINVTGSNGYRGLSLTSDKRIGAKTASRLKAKFSNTSDKMQYIHSDADGKEHILAVVIDSGGPALEVYALWYE